MPLKMYFLTPCCFICLKEISKQKNKLKEGKFTLQEMIKFCCCKRIREDADKEIPIFLCSSCRIYLTSWFTFKKIFVESYKRWQKYVSHLKQNSTSRHHEYKNLEVSLIDFKKHKFTATELLENGLSSNDNKTKFRNMHLSQSGTVNIEYKTKLLSETFKIHENNKNFESNDSQIKNKEELKLKLNYPIKPEVNFNNDLDSGNKEISTLHNIFQIEKKEQIFETQNKTEYDTSIDTQYEIMFCQESNNSDESDDNINIDYNNIFNKDFHDDDYRYLHNSKLSENKIKYNNKTTDGTDVFQINLNYHNKVENDITTDFIDNNIESEIDSNFCVINAESLNMPFDTEDINENNFLPEITKLYNDSQCEILHFEETSNSIGSTRNSVDYNNIVIKNENKDFHDDYSYSYNNESIKNKMKMKNDTKMDLNDVNIKIETDKYFYSSNTAFNIEEESIDIPFDINDEIQIINENISTFDEENFSTIEFNNYSNVTGLIKNNFKTKNVDILLSNNINMKKLDRKDANKNKLYDCLICNKSYVSKTNLKRHINDIHSENRNKFSCDICNKKFNRNDHFKDHVQSHSKRYSCTICKKEFGMRHHLNRHIQIHGGEKQFQCEICKKSFGTKSNYTIHLRIHSGDKPFSCALCEKQFVSSNDMLRHQRIHTKDYKHECPVCEKKFNEKCTLTRHLKIHQKKKIPFKLHE